MVISTVDIRAVSAEISHYQLTQIGSNKIGSGYDLEQPAHPRINAVSGRWQARAAVLLEGPKI